MPASCKLFQNGVLSVHILQDYNDISKVHALCPIKRSNVICVKKSWDHSFLKLELRGQPRHKVHWYITKPSVLSGMPWSFKWYWCCVLSKLIIQSHGQASSYWSCWKSCWAAKAVFIAPSAVEATYWRVEWTSSSCSTIGWRWARISVETSAFSSFREIWFCNAFRVCFLSTCNGNHIRWSGLQGKGEPDKFPMEKKGLEPIVIIWASDFLIIWRELDYLTSDKGRGRRELDRSLSLRWLWRHAPLYCFFPCQSLSSFPCHLLFFYSSGRATIPRLAFLLLL